MTTATRSPGLADFTVDLEPVGLGRFIVNGLDVSDVVRRGALMFDAGNVPTLQLEMRGAGHLEGHGIVQVLADSDGRALTETQVILAFLDSIDVVQLTELTLGASSGMASDPVEGMLHALRTIATQQR